MLLKATDIFPHKYISYNNDFVLINVHITNHNLKQQNHILIKEFINLFSSCIIYLNFQAQLRCQKGLIKITRKINTVNFLLNTYLRKIG